MPELREAPREALAMRSQPAPSFPGAWLALAMVGASALGGWFWAIPMLAGDSTPVTAPRELADVSPADMSGALGTLDGGRAFVEQFAEGSQRCDRKLAWLSIRRADPAVSGDVRLQSGSYVSPVFLLTATPTRVAIPYPAPYETGRGTIVIFGAGGDATLALRPPLRAAPRNGQINQAVTWHPTADCQHGPNG